MMVLSLMAGKAWKTNTGKVVEDMKFTKMHGIGNDYVYVNCFTETVSNPCAAAKFVSDRHFGIGSDGLILIKPSEQADFTMDMYNADGSRGKMCGNGIRCVAKYVYEHKLTEQTHISIETLGGIKYLDLAVEKGQVQSVRVNMGSPELDPAKIPVAYARGNIGSPELDPAKIPVAYAHGSMEETAVRNGDAEYKDIILDAPLTVAGTEYGITCVSMGNPHCVVYVSDVDTLDLEKIGPAFAQHPCFPEGVNTEFVQILDRHTARMRVWERGSGETLACGTGACAVAVASILNGFTDDAVTVQLLGGNLQIEWDREPNVVYMTGTATTVYEGEIVLPDGI